MAARARIGAVGGDRRFTGGDGGVQLFQSRSREYPSCTGVRRRGRDGYRLLSDPDLAVLIQPRTRERRGATGARSRISHGPAGLGRAGVSIRPCGVHLRYANGLPSTRPDSRNQGTGRSGSAFQRAAGPEDTSCDRQQHRPLWRGDTGGRDSSVQPVRDPGRLVLARGPRHNRGADAARGFDPEHGRHRGRVEIGTDRTRRDADLVQTVITTLPTKSPLARQAYASAACSKEKTLSTIGLIWLTAMA